MKTLSVFTILIIAFVFGLGQKKSTPADQQILDDLFKGTTGAMVIYNLQKNEYLRHDKQRCRERFSPKSTFKIANSLIGLETGVIADADFVIEWDREKYPPQTYWDQEPFSHWGQNHTLRSAIKYSVVWYYRELAKKVGAERMKGFIKSFNYGNQEISDAIDNFWLDGSLKISADEQIEFLKKFYLGKIPVSKRSTEIVKDILIMENTPQYELSGKTGGGSIAEGRIIGWFVGYLRTKNGAKDNIYFFATNIEGTSFEEIRDKRIELTKQALAKLRLLPNQ